MAPAPRPSEPSDYRTDLIGSIQLIEANQAGGDVFAYLFADQAVPAETLQASEGECAIYTHAPPGQCDAPCNGYCNAEGTCVPVPGPASAGRIQVSGLLKDLSLVPGEFGYQPSPVPTGDLFLPGADITARAAGDQLPGFVLTGTGVADLTDTIEHIVLKDGQDYRLRWTPAAGDARIQLALRIGWHGAPYEAMLLCQGADDGELIIPGGLITQLPPYGGIGLLPHPSEIMRLVRTVVETEAGAIELVVGSSLVVSFEHM